MASRDLHNNIAVRRAISPAAAVTSDTPIVSQIVDTFGYEAVEFAMAIGNNTDTNATFAVLVEHGDAANLSDAAAVPDANLIGNEAGASFDFSDDNETRKIGYVGIKRYVRVTVTPSGNNSGDIYVAALWLLGAGRSSRPEA